MLIGAALTALMFARPPGALPLPADGPRSSQEPGARGSSVQGELTEFSLRWDRRKDSGSIASDMCDAFSLDSFNDQTPYQIFVMTTETPDRPLDVRVRSLEATALEFDPFVSVYCGPFDPAAPEVGLIALDDDAGGYPDALISDAQGLVIQPGQTYYIVVSSYSSYEGADLGRFVVETGFEPVSPLCVADIAGPIGVLDVSDVLAFLDLYNASNPMADLAPPMGVLDFDDILAFIGVFGAGCP